MNKFLTIQKFVSEQADFWEEISDKLENIPNKEKRKFFKLLSRNWKSGLREYINCVIREEQEYYAMLEAERLAKENNKIEVIPQSAEPTKEVSTRIVREPQNVELKQVDYEIVN